MLSPQIKKSLLYRTLARILYTPFFKTRHGEKWIRKVGHRKYVGGYWELMGQVQFDFLISRGILPNHVLLDIGCGSLRGGRNFISYLNASNYLGIEKEPALVKAGLLIELGADIVKNKKPEIIISSTFEFENFSKKPDFIFAHSVFSHLVPKDILLCLRNLRKFIPTGCRFYASYFEGPLSFSNAPFSCDHYAYYYSKEEIQNFALQTGWLFHSIDKWNHPAGQSMAFFTAE